MVVGRTREVCKIVKYCRKKLRQIKAMKKV